MHPFNFLFMTYMLVVTYFLSTLRPSVSEIKILSGHIKDSTIMSIAPCKMRGSAQLKMVC
jgi:hypothetical protein